MFKKCIEVIKKGKKVVYLAPSREVISFAREKIMENLGGLFYIDVITFDDLARNIVMDKLDRELISTKASLIILQQVIKENLNDISYFNMVALKKGFVISLYNTIRRIKKENLSPNEFLDKVNSIEDSRIKLKSLDVYRIYEKYQEKLNRLKLYDMDDLLRFASDNVKDSQYLKDVELIVLDGYLDIFKNEEALLKSIKNCYNNINFIGNIPLRTDFIDLFIEKEILRVYKDLKVEIYEENKTGDFKLLAKKLFTFERLEKDLNLKIINAPCIEDEVRQAARIIKDIIMNDETELDKIALIVNDLESYQSYILDIFNEYEIPVMLADFENLKNIPLIRSILNLITLRFDLFDKNKLEDVLLSPYLFDLDDKEKLREVLNLTYKGEKTREYIEKLINSDFELKENIKKLKEWIDFIDSILKVKDNDLFENFKGMVVGIIDKLKVKQKIMKAYKEGLIPIDIALRDMKALLAFLDLLEELNNSYKLLRNSISFEEFIEIINENINEVSVTLKNKPSYGIKVLSPDLIRGISYDYVLILGLNEGIFPRNFGTSGIYTSREKEIFYKNGINLGARSFEYDKEKIRFIMSIASCEKGIFLSYRTSNEDGSYIIKSAFLDEVIFTLGIEEKVKKLYQRCMRDRFNLKIENIYTKKELINSYSLGFYDDAKFLQKLDELTLSYIQKGKEMEFLRWSEKFTNYDGLVGENKAQVFNCEYAFSVSTINYFLNCPFKFFLENLIEVGYDEEDDIFSHLSEGNLYHEVLKEYYKYFIDRGYEIEYDELFIEDIVEKIMRKKGILETNILIKRRKAEILNVIKSFLKKDIEFLNKFNLRPILVEHTFVSEKIIEGVKIKGRIDRVDMEILDGKPTGYFVVYDYKKGDVKDKNLIGILKGNDIQISTYFYVVQNILREKGFDPKAIALLYYSIKNTAKEGKPKYSGIIIEDTKNKIGVKGKTVTLSCDNFDTVLEYIKKSHIESRIERIKKGDFTLPLNCPKKGFNKFSCSFSDICRYELDRILKKARW
ncbi:ATP-dependent helicase/DNAse subunit B [Caloramator fervidus]|uniref:ATP-dependent helicase/DNAse subunit B n=1 Tax=Caloramator fervidus TaxID=29344 RepID=A0A1H5TD70_9CLOT|nr:PD-(D/E)XK nuclease family protein [Caloramator fervidus]SEF60704.1 ATP-dependent helicase/DNAse subunit B [Caloramator fervidus]